MTTHPTSPRSFTTLTLGLALTLAGALAFSACDDDDGGDSGGDTNSQADDGGTAAADGGGDDTCGSAADDGGEVTPECQTYLDCAENMCGDCLDECSDYIDCAAGCGCGTDATMCQTDCLAGQTAECSQCFLDQGTCIGQMCAAELMACGSAG